MDILFPILLLAGIGLVLGLILAIASVIFAVPKDEIAEEIENILPGANCGACGYSGCSGYAAALSRGEAKPGLCTVGGDNVSQEIAKILNVSVEAKIKNVSFVYCNGTDDNISYTMEYQGINSCRDAVQIHGGEKSCGYGCLGYGDCIKVCEFNAIKICDGIANINADKCTACKKCIKACPKSLISMIPVKKQAIVKCSNCDKGGSVKKNCKVGCVACGMCVKACPVQAIALENNLAKVDPMKCVGCGKCIDACKFGCISMIFKDVRIKKVKN